MPYQELVSWERLDGAHKDALFQAIRNVLATDVALQTYAQIIDGLPTADVQYDKYSYGWYDADHPIEQHSDVCPLAVKEAEKQRAEFDPATLKFKPDLLDAFQKAPLSSRAFNMRLIELVAVSVHGIGVFLFQQRSYLHDPTTTGGHDVAAVTAYNADEDPLRSNEWKQPSQPTLFFLASFRRWNAYPNGAADMVGYWAENRILGGVALFNHSLAWSEEEPEPNVYWDSDHSGMTCRVCQLLDKQQAKLLSFLTRASAPSSVPADAAPRPAPGLSSDAASVPPSVPVPAKKAKCPIPIRTTSRNRNRINVDLALPVYKVYRDTWERYLIKVPEGRNVRDRDVLPTLDYPELRHPDEVETDESD